VWVKRAVLALGVAFAATVAVVSDAPAGGISDEPCPNVAGEHTNTCPPGQVGMPYDLRFVETEGSGCGPGKQTFHVDSGVLPPGLALAPDGTLSGTPTQAARFQFYVEMSEPQDDPASCAGKKTQKQFTLTICRQLTIVSSPTVPPRAEVGVAFRMALAHCGGMGGLVWTVSAGELPAGLRLGAHGSISGAPRVAGTYRFTARATDTQLRSASFTGTITVAPRLRVRAQLLRAARVGHPYRAELSTVGGVGRKVWTIERGRLPRGIRLASALGTLTGTPEQAGKHRLTIEVRDRLGVRAARTVTIVVLAKRPLRVGTAPSQ
jgi:large repetitive protein